MKNNIINFRNKRNWTQKETARSLGVTTSYLGMIELGTRTPSLSLAYKISLLFNTTIEEIFF